MESPCISHRALLCVCSPHSDIPHAMHNVHSITSSFTTFWRLFHSCAQLVHTYSTLKADSTFPGVCTLHNLYIHLDRPLWFPSISHPSAQRKMKGFLRDWKNSGSWGRYTVPNKEYKHSVVEWKKTPNPDKPTRHTNKTHKYQPTNWYHWLHKR